MGVHRSWRGGPFVEGWRRDHPRFLEAILPKMVNCVYISEIAFAVLGGGQKGSQLLLQ